MSSRGYPGTAPPLGGAVSAYPLLLPLPPKIPPKTWGKTPPLRVGAYALLKCPFMRIFRAISRQIVQGGLGKKSPEFGKYWANHLEPFKEITCRPISLSPLPESFKSFYTLLPTSNAPIYAQISHISSHWHICITYPKLHSKTRPFRQYSHIFSH